MRQIKTYLYYSITRLLLYVSRDSETMDSNCSHLAPGQYKALAAIKGSCGVVSILATLLVIFFIVLYKVYKNFVFRIVLYLALTNLIKAAFYVMQAGAMQHYQGPTRATHEKLCIAVAVVLHYASWINILMSFWISFTCFLLAVFEILPKNREKWWLGATVTIPLLVVFWPLIGDRYGMAGAWCGVKARNKDCRLNPWGVVAQFLLGYFPDVVVMVVDSLLIIITFVVVARNYYRERAQYQPISNDRHLEPTYLEAVKEFLPLLGYPIVLIALYTVPLANRIYNTTHGNQQFVFWVFHALCSPLQGSGIAACFLCHPQILKKLRPSKIKEAAMKWKAGPHINNYSPPRTPIASTDNSIASTGV